MSSTPRQQLIEEAYGAIEALHKCAMPRKEKVMADLNLNHRQAKTLWFLSSHESATVGEIADWHDISKSLATLLIESLVERDLIVREGVVEDRRIVTVHLSAEGKKLLKVFREMLLKNMQHHLEQLSDQELSTMAEISKKLIVN